MLKRVRSLFIVLALGSLLLVGCQKEPNDALSEVFGPVAQKVQSGEDWVALSPNENGTRTVGYVDTSGKDYRLVNKEQVADPSGSATMKLEGDLVVVETQKEGAPQFTAFRLSSSGLEAVDYYTERAPEPDVKTGHYILVNKYMNVLWHYRDGSLVNTYRVTTGRQTEPPAPTWEDYRTNFFTPEGTFHITSFVVNPSYGGLKPGDDSYAGGASGNPLGTRWMGFPVLENDNAGVWGIHGTSEPELIGTWGSDGCIRMYTEQAEELFEQIQNQDVVLQVVRK